MPPRAGITVQHTRDVPADAGLVRSDIAGLIGLIRADRWPGGGKAGDFLEVPLVSYEDLAASALAELIDPVSRRAVRCYFENGGEKLHLFGLCVEGPRQLSARDPFKELFFALADRLKGNEDLGLLCMPILAYLGVGRDGRGRPISEAQPTLEFLVEHCAGMNNRFAVLDPPRDLHEDALLAWTQSLRNLLGQRGAYAALYYPWLNYGDESFPPSGAVSGLFARSDREHAPFGVRWPPANQLLRGVTHPSVPIRWSESDRLMEEHLNLLLTQPSRGVVVWGARTLSRDPNWRHINARRIVSLVAEQLRRDNEWVVFENQRPELWEIVTRTTRSRLDSFWGAGLLAGDKAGSEYEVQCDAELNPPESRNAGIVQVKVTVRPIATTESIVIDLRFGG